MDNPLSAESLIAHVRVLASNIGPRPTGRPAEIRAREYIQQFLAAQGIDTLEEQSFQTRPTAAIGFFVPLGLTFLANAISLLGRGGRFLGSILTLLSATSIWRLYSGQRSLFEVLEPKVTSANLIARLPPSQDQQQTLVFIGHVDSQQRQALTEAPIKYSLLRLYTIWLGMLVANGVAQAFPGWVARLIQLAILAPIGMTTRQAVQESKNAYVDGANDNATAVACLLGLGAWFHRNPLRHTEVWLVFTGAEETICTGMHHFLDAHGDRLRDAWFIDFEMVGTSDIAYVTRHSGLSYLNAYRPDSESLQLAYQTSQRVPELDVRGQEMVMVEEVGTLVGRGFRGLCLAGVGEDGWLVNWHLATDTTENIVPEGMERTARFACALAKELDTKKTPVR